MTVPLNDSDSVLPVLPPRLQRGVNDPSFVTIGGDQVPNESITCLPFSYKSVAMNPS